MLIRFDPTGSVDGFQRTLSECLDEGAQNLLVLGCDANGFTPAGLDPILTAVPLPVFGGLFPAIIHEGQKMDRGTIVVGLPGKANVTLITDMGTPQNSFEELLEQDIHGADSIKTMFVFVDGFAHGIGDFIRSLFNVFGLEFNYVGGGAGSLNMSSRPCLITPAGLIMDAAVLAGFELNSGVGVSHGWRSVGGPYKVTESDGNIIRSLDWRPAFNLYREFVETHSRRGFKEDNFFDIAKAYPFGITKMGTERVVRDPFSIGADKSLVCVGDVPEGSFVDILHGGHHSLIKAAERAATLADEAFGPPDRQGLRILMDCISRVLFLEKRFALELDAVRRPGRPMVGACTLGEIANQRSDYLEFYNKTAVVAVLEA